MTDDDTTETTDELEVAIAGLAGVSLDALHVAVTVAPRGGDVEETTSMVAALSHREPVRWEVRGDYHEWIVALIGDRDGRPLAVTADGALRVGPGPDARRYPLPARRGLAAVWCADDGTILVCGPGALGRVRLGAGRIAIDVTDDDGPGEPLAVAGPGAVDGAIAVGTHGALWRLDGDEWIAHETPAREALVDVAWHPGGVAYVVGADGGVYAWDGRGLRELARTPGAAWTSIACWRDDVYLVNARRGVWRLVDGAPVAWKALPVTRVRAVADHLFAWGGTLLARHDGAGWWGGPLHLP